MPGGSPGKQVGRQLAQTEGERTENNQGAYRPIPKFRDGIRTGRVIESEARRAASHRSQARNEGRQRVQENGHDQGDDKRP
jgi:hypothetical protein